jgi:quinol-cytochrome oxidoreductase complex cytochrome b subunit
MVISHLGLSVFRDFGVLYICIYIILSKYGVKHHEMHNYLVILQFASSRWLATAFQTTPYVPIRNHASNERISFIICLRSVIR